MWTFSHPHGLYRNSQMKEQKKKRMTDGRADRHGWIDRSTKNLCSFSLCNTHMHTHSTIAVVKRGYLFHKPCWLQVITEMTVIDKISNFPQSHQRLLQILAQNPKVHSDLNLN